MIAVPSGVSNSHPDRLVVSGSIGFESLPRRFTLRRLQAVHEAVLGRAVNKDSFRRRMLASGRVLAIGKREEGVLHRPAGLCRFSRRH